MSKFIILNKSEYMPKLKVTLNKNGNLVFSQTAKRLINITGKQVVFFLDEEDKENPLTISFTDRCNYEAFPIIYEDNGICYLPTEKIFEKIDIDYTNGPIDFYLEPEICYGNQTYHLVRTDYTKKPNKNKRNSR